LSRPRIRARPRWKIYFWRQRLPHDLGDGRDDHARSEECFVRDAKRRRAKLRLGLHRPFVIRQGREWRDLLLPDEQHRRKNFHARARRPAAAKPSAAKTALANRRVRGLGKTTAGKFFNPLL